MVGRKLAGFPKEACIDWLLSGHHDALDVSGAAPSACEAPMTARFSPRCALITVFSTALLAACATGAYRRADTRPGVQVITAEQIARSGASTAWDVLKREAPTLTLRDTRGGRPGSAGRRGRSSIVLQDAPLVVLDGVRLTDFRALDGIPAATILTISIRSEERRVGKECRARWVPA